MANVRLTMRKIREVLRLHFECDRNQREIADAVGASTTTVWHYLRRTRLAGLSRPLPHTTGRSFKVFRKRMSGPAGLHPAIRGRLRMFSQTPLATLGVAASQTGLPDRSKQRSQRHRFADMCVEAGLQCFRHVFPTPKTG
jgi:hypothetical protein